MIWLGFFLSTAMAALQTALFPHLVLLAYAPFVALCCLHLPFQRALWLSALAGLGADLFSADPPGTHALTATLVCAALFRARKLFFKEQPLQLCLYTALVSAAWTPLQLVVFFLFDRRAPFAGQWAFLDFLVMPLIDAAYAFFWFVGPLLLWDWLTRQYKLWRLKKHEST